MHTLYLLRHAEAAPAAADTPDEARVLTPQGRSAATQVASWLRRRRAEPELVLCSPATRARQTLALLDLPGVSAHVEEDLYLAGAVRLHERLRQVDDAVGSVLVVGHNPGLHELAWGLSRPGSARALLRRGFPPAALAVLASPRWSALAGGDAEVVALVSDVDTAPR